MFDLFKKRAILDEPTIDWLFQIYCWALTHFDADVFYNEMILVTPSNDHFPGRENSAQGMAQLIFGQVKQYAGLSHWPCRLVDEDEAECLLPPKEAVAIHGAIWGAGGEHVDGDGEQLPITYVPGLVSNPQALIASYAQQLAHHMSTMVKDELPGGRENWLHMTEVLAVMLGFGVMFANTALIIKTGCGGCGGVANRGNALGEPDITYALAIFCVLKGIPAKEVTPHLKSSLRGYFKSAVKDVMTHQESLKQVPGYRVGK